MHAGITSTPRVVELVVHRRYSRLFSPRNACIFYCLKMRILHFSFNMWHRGHPGMYPHGFTSDMEACMLFLKL